jgi:positive regulator of sigma E activity
MALQRANIFLPINTYQTSTNSGCNLLSDTAPISLSDRMAVQAASIIYLFPIIDLAIIGLIKSISPQFSHENILAKNHSSCILISKMGEI